MTASTQSADYFVPSPSPFPFLVATGLVLMAFGAGFWLNGVPHAEWVLIVGFIWLIATLYRWFGRAISESEGGMHNLAVDSSFRWSMSWFIFSEVMFFASFFGALYYARAYGVPDLASLQSKILWPNFSATWPNVGPAGLIPAVQAMSPWPIPTINTALLLSSGLTLTIAHHALRVNHRSRAVLWLSLTILLGLIFLFLQAYEYHHAYTELGLKLSSGIYGSTFFMLTGFHGFHVLLGATMLSVVLFRLIRGDFTADHHFAFEGAAWYWHFVDVVWLLLYVLVYWL
ncbi:cytochrome c oxidase subunit 3 [mine drainage metagenome]|uniref:cytochrome-c oxidase n=1 Tax=mine drainage metagenome TaxID=410659 RepID=A0A1J5RDM4_9ZZZZ